MRTVAIGFVINALIVLAAYAAPDLRVIVPFVVPFLVLNIIGMLLLSLGKARAGCITYIVGCVAFVPAGLVGIVGARTLLDAQRRTALAPSRRGDIIHEFETNKKLVALMLIAGCFIAVAGLFLALNGGSAMPLGLSMMMVALGFWHLNNRPVRMYDEHLEIKLAPAAKLQVIPYQNVVRMERRSPKVQTIFFKEDGAEKKFQLALSSLNEEDRLKLARLMRQVVTDSGAPTSDEVAAQPVC